MSDAYRLDIPALKSAIESENLGWTPGDSHVTALSSDEQLLLLGYTPGPDEPSLEEAEQQACAALDVEKSAATAEAYGYPTSYDGRSFAGPVKHQGSCGSCVAFGTCATVEGTLRKSRNDPNLSVDYSEAQLFYCHARSEGRRCNNGWWSSKALDAFRDKGVVDEACYPYTPGDQNCTGLCSDHENRITKIPAWHRITSPRQMKEWLSTRGPLVACYTVYSDFSAYRSGIYRKSANAVRRGGHCVCCVGYNDSQGYWICKNSWGNSWGNNGYFFIAYGQCGIDNGMDAVDGVLDVPWQRNKRITGLWTNQSNRNAFVHVHGLGWRKVSNDNDNIFFNMLSDLIAAKAGNRPVNLLLQNNVIKQVYVL